MAKFVYMWIDLFLLKFLFDREHVRLNGIFIFEIFVRNVFHFA